MRWGSLADIRAAFRAVADTYAYGGSPLPFRTRDEEFWNRHVELRILNEALEARGFAPLTTADATRLGDEYGMYIWEPKARKPRASGPRRPAPDLEDVLRAVRAFVGDRAPLSLVNQKLKEDGFAPVSEEQARRLGVTVHKRMSAQGRARNITLSAPA